MEQLSFDLFSAEVERKFDELTKADGALLVSDVDTNLLWDTYLNSFPEEVNKIFKTRRKYDCQCCKLFIKRVGNAVLVKNGVVVDTVWNITTQGYYQQVADSMHQLLMQYGAWGKFVSDLDPVGKKTTYNHNDDLIFSHFEVVIPQKFKVLPKLKNGVLGSFLEVAKMFKRVLDTVDIHHAETVLDLININNLYRGAEYKHFVEFFIKHKRVYDTLNERNKFNYAHEVVATNDETLCRLGNTVIGTLLYDLADGKDLENAVSAYEHKTAPTNYRRTTAIVTPQMIEQAKKAIQDMGYDTALKRRIMLVSEVGIENILWRGEVKKSLDVFDDLKDEQQALQVIKQSKLTIDRTLDDFISKVLPVAEQIEILFNGRLTNHLCTLTTNDYPEPKQLFKWSNHGAWSYNGGVTDRIKETVKNAGGFVDGEFRVSLAWSNSDDLDLHCFFTEKNCLDCELSHKRFNLACVKNITDHCYFGNKARMGGIQLDVDANGGYVTNSTSPVENIFATEVKDLRKGYYTFYVHNFNARNGTNNGYQIQFELHGDIRTFELPRYKSDEDRKVFTFYYDGNEVTLLQVDKELTEVETSGTEVWGMKTNTFVPVTLLTTSPNYWGDNAIGNKHYIFVVDGCNNPDPVRTMYVEYLNNDLLPHKRTFEILAEKLKTQPCEYQASGFGFSVSSKSEFVARVTNKQGEKLLYLVKV